MAIHRSFIRDTNLLVFPVVHFIQHKEVRLIVMFLQNQPHFIHLSPTGQKSVCITDFKYVLKKSTNQPLNLNPTSDQAITQPVSITILSKNSVPRTNLSEE